VLFEKTLLKTNFNIKGVSKKNNSKFCKAKLARAKKRKRAGIVTAWRQCGDKDGGGAYV
jgi:hypothetical protein